MRERSAAKSLKIAYVTKGSASDVNNWSGIVVYIRKALESAGHEISVIDGIQPCFPFSSRLRGAWVRAVTGKTYAYDRDLGLAARFARGVERRLSHLLVDCVVAPLASTVSMLRTNLPVAVWDDGPFHVLQQQYGFLSGMAIDSIRQANELERLTMRKAVLLAYASHWAAEDAINFYHADPSKVTVVPFGANCDSPYENSSQVKTALDTRPNSSFRLLFAGYDWERKGGPIALATQRELRRRGVNAELWVVGGDPFHGAPPSGVRVFGRLSKSDPVQSLQWSQCFRECHAFIMPSRAECFGIVFAEAAAHALPSFAARVGGVPDAVAEGRSGWIFEPSASANEYADVLQCLAQDRTLLAEASLRAWDHHKKNLNWQTSGQRFTERLLATLGGEEYNRPK